jgi:peptide chain release factor 3
MMQDPILSAEVQRRRTFAIISHPDAGKTTLTEKLLLFTGAIQIAGSVKARKAARHATSDWMEIEKQRGISVASSVMQMEFGGCVINLLDTPGHQDFSEDTYRVLTAVDSALMVIDAANGVESQTLRLIDVCRTRNTPVLTFVNKLDREVRDPLELLEEIENALGMPCSPTTWPVGRGKFFRGIYNLVEKNMRIFASGQARVSDDDEIVTDHAELQRRFPDEWGTALAEMEIVESACPAFEAPEFLAGRQTPVFFGSAINNFGVKEILESLVRIAPAPKERVGMLNVGTRAVQPDEKKFSGVVFKIQANMDPSHRDRIAFLRVCSGKFDRGMRLKVRRNGKELRPTGVVTFLSQRRDLVEQAYAGDIIGIITHGGLQLGDTVTEGEALQFTGLPFFAPELFRSVELADPLRGKQLDKGLKELGEEGAIQVFRPLVSNLKLLGAVGQLQFEVVQHRLKSEYGVDVRLGAANFSGARWITAKDPNELRRFVDTNPTKVALDAADTQAYMMSSQYELRVMQERWPNIQFHPLREHAGLVLV